MCVFVCAHIHNKRNDVKKMMTLKKTNDYDDDVILKHKTSPYYPKKNVENKNEFNQTKRNANMNTE